MGSSLVRVSRGRGVNIERYYVGEEIVGRPDRSEQAVGCVQR